MTTNELATMSAGVAPSEPAAPARLFVVCGRGCSSEELASLFGEFGVVSEVRCVPDKGVAYVQFSRDDPFAASRAIESVGANDDGEIEGGVASCRKFLGGCERTLRIMLADDHNAGASVVFSGNASLSLSLGEASAEPQDVELNSWRIPNVGSVSPNHSAVTSDDTRAKKLETKETQNEIDPDDDPPRSRLFVVCPKGVSQEILRTAFVQLLTRLRQEHDEERDDSSGAKEKAEGSEIDADPPPGPADLESVRVVPHKGVAFAKFSRASVAVWCMEAVSGTGTLGGVRVKCMLAEPKASPASVRAALSGARPRVDREGSRSPGGSPKRRRAVAEQAEHKTNAALTPSKTIRGTAPPKLGVRPRPPSPASSAESGGARPAATRARATRASRAFEKSAFFHYSSSGKSSGAHTAAAPPPPPLPPPPGHPTRHPSFPVLSQVPSAAVPFAFPGYPPQQFAQSGYSPSPPLPPGPVPWGAAYSFLVSPSVSGDASAGGVSTTKGRSSSTSKRRVFVVLDKGVTKTQLERAFRDACEGVEAVDLKRDPEGNSRGFAYVTFTETPYALAAAERLDGAEIPPGMGKRVKVMPAEEPLRRGRGSRANSHSGVSASFEATTRAGRYETETETETDDREAHVREVLRRPREEGDEDVSSWQAPGKHPRIATISVENSLDSDENDRETTAEDEAGEATRALGKVTLSSLAGVDTKEPKTRRENQAEKAVQEGSEDLDATAANVLDADTAVQSPGRLFFSLALPLPSYAVRHVLDTKGVVAKLHMRRDGASGWAEYAEEDDADAAAAALDGTEILGIEFRLSRKPFGDRGAEVVRGEGGNGNEDIETSEAEDGVAAKKRARTTLTS